MTVEEISATKFTGQIPSTCISEAQKTVQAQRIIRQSFSEDVWLKINMMVKSSSDFYY